ncbi:MAG: hypothetical protein ACJ71Z_07555 [Aeromicrobium sp.]
MHIDRGHVRRALASLLLVATLSACGNDQAATAACRKQFAAQHELMDARGNPGHKDFTPGLTARWDALDAQFARLGTEATADDCPDRLAALKRRAKRVESVLHKLDDYDVARMLTAGERDLQADEDKLGASRDYVLITTARTMRESATAAERSLAPFVARVDAVDPAKYSALAAAMVALYDAAASDAALADFKEARNSIHDYEPPQK